MKLLLLALVVSACASRHAPKPLPAFERLAVCSDTSLKYLEGTSDKKAPLSREDDEKIKDYMNKVAFLVKGCYQSYLDRAVTPVNLHLCYVTGTNADGKRTFFEFSNKSEKMTPEFWDCLDQIETGLPYPELKDVFILQNYRLHTNG